MIPNYGKQWQEELAPEWAEQSAPRNKLKQLVPGLILISMPSEDYWVVATESETDAIADPNSPLGQLLRSHCALLSLPYASDN